MNSQLTHARYEPLSDEAIAALKAITNSPTITMGGSALERLITEIEFGRRDRLLLDILGLSNTTLIDRGLNWTVEINGKASTGGTLREALRYHVLPGDVAALSCAVDERPPIDPTTIAASEAPGMTELERENAMEDDARREANMIAAEANRRDSESAK